MPKTFQPTPSRVSETSYAISAPLSNRTVTRTVLVRAARLMHGKTSPIHHDGRTIFRGLSQPFEATRYHSLLIERSTLPACLELSAWTAEGEIMGVRHRQHLVEGIQFHPESILTIEGKHLLKNFLDLTRGTLG